MVRPSFHRRTARRLAALVLLPLSLVASAAEPIKIAAPGLTVVSVTPEMAAYYAEHLGQKLAFQGLRIVTAKEIEALVGFERQKQLLGCADDGCITDIAGALGADALLVGDVARIGKNLNFNLRILSARNGDRLAAFSAKLDSEDAVLETLDRAAELMAPEVARKLGRPLAPAAGSRTQQLSTGPRAWAWMPAAGGLALGAAGTTFLLFARDHHLQLRGTSGVLTGTEANRLRREGATYQAVGITGVALGAVGVGAAAVLFFMGGAQSTVQTGLSLTPDGATLTFAGVLP